MSNKIPPQGVLTLIKNNKKEKLIKDIERLISSLNEELGSLKNNPYHKINSCGIIQDKATAIDSLCCEIATISETIDIIEGNHILSK